MRAYSKETDRANVNVLVKDAETGQPIANAALTLTFKDPRAGLRRDKMLSFSAKTNLQGRTRFVSIPKGSIRLFVTAENHQSYGKQLQLEQDAQLFEIKLRKPQPLL